MLQQSLRDLCDNFKSSHSCVDYLNNNGFHIPAPDAFILSPFRNEHNPSFIVHDSFCKDFGTGESFDIFKLDMLLHHRSFRESFEALTGLSLASRPRDIKALDHVKFMKASLLADINRWHQALLDDTPVPQFNTSTQQIDPKLTRSPLEYLHSRGINDDTIRKFKIGVCVDSKGWGRGYEFRIIFPYFNNGTYTFFAGRDFSGRAGIVDGVHKYKKKYIDTAGDNIPWGFQTHRLARSKKTYTGSDGELHALPAVHDIKDDVLVLCEGAVDILSFAQHDWQCLSPIGGDFRAALLPQIYDLMREFKYVFICFDNDPSGESFRQKWAERLFSHRIPFICGHTAPAGGKEQKLDVSSYYQNAVEHQPENLKFQAGEAALLKLVKNAVPGLQELAKSLNDVHEIETFLKSAARFASKSDMHSLFKFIISRTKLDCFNERGEPVYGPFFSAQDRECIEIAFQEAMKAPDQQTVAEEVHEAHPFLWNVGDGFYSYKNGIWKRTDELFISNWCMKALGHRANVDLIRKVTRMCKIMYPQEAVFNSQHVFTFTNGTLLLDELDDKGRPGKLVKHNPSFMATAHVGYAFDPEAKCSKWERFIRQVFKNDKALIKRAQEAMGYVLFAQNTLQKIFYLIGDGANGKSTFLAILNEIYGKENCSNLRPDRLASQFDPIVLQNSLANICYEARRDFGDVETLKATASGDPFMASRKGVDAITVQSRAKWFFAMNSLFNAADISWGFMRRILFIPFEQTFSPDPKFGEIPADTNLLAKLREELPGIFNWCLEGYRRLVDNQGFTEVIQQVKYLEKLQEHIEPELLFMRENFTGTVMPFLAKTVNDPVTGQEVTTYANRKYPNSVFMYSKYKEWCKEGCYKPWNRTEFTERFAELLQYLTRDNGLAPIEVRRLGRETIFIFHEIDEFIMDANHRKIADEWAAKMEALRAEQERQVNSNAVTQAPEHSAGQDKEQPEEIGQVNSSVPVKNEAPEEEQRFVLEPLPALDPSYEQELLAEADSDAKNFAAKYNLRDRKPSRSFCGCVSDFNYFVENFAERWGWAETVARYIYCYSPELLKFLPGSVWLNFCKAADDTPLAKDYLYRKNRRIFIRGLIQHLKQKGSAPHA